MKTYYVAGFMFSPDLKNVILIKKNKPDWQVGKYNGVGGKIEAGETPEVAMSREFEEEAGIETNYKDWNLLAIVGDDSYEVFFFYMTSKKWENYLTQTDEEVFHLPVENIHAIGNVLISNLKWLIPLALDKLNNYSGHIRLQP